MQSFLHKTVQHFSLLLNLAKTHGAYYANVEHLFQSAFMDIDYFDWKYVALWEKCVKASTQTSPLNYICLISF